MLWFWIIGGIVFVIIFIIGTIEGDIGVGIGMGAFLGVVAGGLLGLGLLANVVGDKVYEDIPIQVEEYELVAIGDSSQIKGSFAGLFFVAVGSIENKLYYMYYYENEDGIRYSRLRASRDDVVIKEEEREDAILRVYSDVSRLNKWGFQRSAPQVVTYEFVVPEGTVKRSFTLDLQK